MCIDLAWPAETTPGERMMKPGAMGPEMMSPHSGR
jgi:hypothetical protein